MASVATAWLMTTLDPSPLTVALVSAATGLPLFLFALPAGALADIVDRRKLLIVARVFMMALVIVLLVLSMAGLITPWTLLILIFLIETGTAFETPPSWPCCPNSFPRGNCKPALALNGVGINISRIVGPALGGLVVGAVGVVAALAINAITFGAVIFAYARLPPTKPETCLPAERLLAAMRTGWRFTRVSCLSSRRRWCVQQRSSCSPVPIRPFCLWSRVISLPPVASGFGVLFGFHGAGAVLGALLLPYVRERLSPDQLVLGGGLMAAAMTALLATAHHIAVAIPIMLITGAGSLAIMSTLMLSAQVALPPWVKARGLAVVQMVFSGALTLGSLLWGALADWAGIPWTLVVAGAGLAGASFLTLRWRLPSEGGRRLQAFPALATIAGSITNDRGPGTRSQTLGLQQATARRSDGGLSGSSGSWSLQQQPFP